MMKIVYNLLPYLPFIVLALAVVAAIYHIEFYW